MTQKVWTAITPEIMGPCTFSEIKVDTWHSVNTNRSEWVNTLKCTSGNGQDRWAVGEPCTFDCYRYFEPITKVELHL